MDDPDLNAGASRPGQTIPDSLIFLAGVAIATGADKWLEAQIVPLLPDAWLRVTTLF